MKIKPIEEIRYVEVFPIPGLLMFGSGLNPEASTKRIEFVTTYLTDQMPTGKPISQKVVFVQGSRDEETFLTFTVDAFFKQVMRQIIEGGESNG